MALSFIGEQLGLPLYYAALFAFGNRLFNNFGVLRRLLIDKYSGKNKPTTKIN
jgi:small basic protein